jgi:hypothetical protein
MTDSSARLRQFFSGYFNQDWDIDGAKNWLDVMEAYLSQHSKSEVTVTRNDLRTWLREPNPKERALSALGCDYDPHPDGMDERSWVAALADYIDERL